jgi:hypothetical protein
MKTWDIFISHASEDKQSVAIPLHDALVKAGLKIWLDKHELKLGDSLREKIDEGLANSRFGIVILSPSFLAKGWPRRELNGLFAIEEAGEKVILPIWHDIDRDRLVQYSPILASRFAANTQAGIQSIAESIIDVVLYQSSGSPSKELPSVSRRFIEVLSETRDLSRIRDFLIGHQRVLANAVGFIFPSDKITKSPKLGRFRPDICLASLNAYTSNAAMLIILGPMSGPLFYANGIPCGELSFKVNNLESILNWAKSNPMKASRKVIGLSGMFRKTFFYGTIFAGRRDALTDEEKHQLQMFNYSNPFPGYKIRTYDHLVEQFINAEEACAARMNFHICS